MCIRDRNNLDPVSSALTYDEFDLSQNEKQTPFSPTAFVLSGLFIVALAIMTTFSL